MNISEQKRSLRTLIRPQLRALAANPQRRTTLSSDVAARVLQSDAWQRATAVLLFVALPDEVDTTPLLEAALAAGKTIYLPRVVGDDLEVCLYTPGALATGAFGISEPTGPALASNQLKCIDLALVPGIAFSKSGDRLGRGRGYYDRLLPHLACPTYGLCYPFQLVDSLPLEPWDCTLSGVFV